MTHSDPFFALDEPPTAEAIAAQAAWAVEETAVQRLITECAARPAGHAWELEGEPEEEPSLSCADCPAVGHDLLEDCLDLVDGHRVELGGQVVHFGQPLPVDADGYRIPVNVELMNVIHESGPWGPEEYDVELRITDRPAAEPAPLWVLCDPCGVMVRTPHACPASKSPECPTESGERCGKCDADILAQARDPRYASPDLTP